jgi:hypothetical protein
MKLTIIPADGSVGENGKFYIGLDLSSCNIPADVHAFQWEENEPNKGHIEFKSPLIQNQDVTELPDWVNACLVKWDEAKAAEEAVKQAAQQTGQ